MSQGQTSRTRGANEGRAEGEMNHDFFFFLGCRGTVGLSQHVTEGSVFRR